MTDTNLILNALGKNLRCSIGMHNLQRQGRVLSFDYVGGNQVQITHVGDGDYMLIFNDIEGDLYATIDTLRDVFEIHSGLCTVLGE